MLLILITLSPTDFLNANLKRIFCSIWCPAEFQVTYLCITLIHPNSTLNASTASAGIGTVSHVDLLTYLLTRSDGACGRGRSTRPSVDPRPGPVHIARARAAFSSTFKFTQARSADSARRPTLYFNAIFPGLPCPPTRSRPAAARTVACQLPRQRLTVPAPTVTPALRLFLLHLSAGQTRPGVQIPLTPTRQSPLSSTRSACSPPGRGGKPSNGMIPPAPF